MVKNMSCDKLYEYFSFYLLRFILRLTPCMILTSINATKLCEFSNYL